MNSRTSTGGLYWDQTKKTGTSGAHRLGSEVRFSINKGINLVSVFIDNIEIRGQERLKAKVVYWDETPMSPTGPKNPEKLTARAQGHQDLLRQRSQGLQRTAVSLAQRRRARPRATRNVPAKCTSIITTGPA